MTSAMKSWLSGRAGGGKTQETSGGVYNGDLCARTPVVEVALEVNMVMARGANRESACKLLECLGGVVAAKVLGPDMDSQIAEAITASVWYAAKETPGLMRELVNGGSSVMRPVVTKWAVTGITTPSVRTRMRMREKRVEVQLNPCAGKAVVGGNVRGTVKVVMVKASKLAEVMQSMSFHHIPDLSELKNGGRLLGAPLPVAQSSKGLEDYA